MQMCVCHSSMLRRVHSHYTWKWKCFPSWLLQTLSLHVYTNFPYKEVHPLIPDWFIGAILTRKILTLEVRCSVTQCNKTLYKAENSCPCWAWSTLTNCWDVWDCHILLVWLEWHYHQNSLVSSNFVTCCNPTSPIESNAHLNVALKVY